MRSAGTQVAAVIVETALATIASIILMVSERKKDKMRLTLQQTIDDAQREMDNL